jgi:hypothetical protein
MFINLTTYFHVGFGSPTKNTSNPHNICMQNSNTTYLGALESPLDFATEIASENSQYNNSI